MKRNIIPFVAAAVILFGCQEKPEPEPVPIPEPEAKLEVNPNSISFDCSASEKTITITASQEWKAVVEGEGFSISSSAGKGNAEVKVSAGANESLDKRKGSISITSGKLSAKVELSQTGEKPVILVEGDSVEVPAEGGHYEIDVKYNTDYGFEIEQSAQSWLHCVGTRALQEGKIEFVVDANESEGERSAKVTISGKKASDLVSTITFTQKGRESYFEVTSDHLDVYPYSGGTFKITVKSDKQYTLDIEPIDYHVSYTQAGDGFDVTVKPNGNDRREWVLSLQDKDGIFEAVHIRIAQDANPDYSSLVGLYKAMDGKSWNNASYWLSNNDINSWSGVQVDEQGLVRTIDLADQGLNGTIPECIGDFTHLKELTLSDSGIKGKLPETIGNLTALEILTIRNTSLSGPLPDAFENMKELKCVYFLNNSKLDGTLPPSLGSSPALEEMVLYNNAFTGTVPEEWCRKDKSIDVSYNCLSGYLPADFFTMPSARRNLWGSYYQKDGFQFDLGYAENIPGNYPSEVETQYNGKTFTYDEVISKNKYTVEFFWASWRPSALSLLAQLKEMYDKYHKDGLEIITYAPLDARDGDTHASDDRIQRLMNLKGYGKWYNIHPSKAQGLRSYAAIPSARVYDSNGNVVFSFEDYKDSGHDRFNRNTEKELISFLEGIFGPAGRYESSDWSEDGKTFTIQKASKGNGINIVFLGDGYTDRDLAAGGEYEMQMRDAAEELFSVEPFKSLRDRFNIYSVKAVSKEEYVGNGHSTVFETERGADGTPETTSGNVSRILEYAGKVNGITLDGSALVIVMCNDFTSGGTTILDNCYLDNLPNISWVTTQGGIASLFDQGYGGALIHEVGHGFGLLSDEYFSARSDRPTEKTISGAQYRYDNFGAGANIDYTNERTKIRWAHMLADSRYRDIVGIYEGGEYYQYGAFRPSEESVMRNSHIKRYNAPSREAIYKRIMLLSGEYSSLSDYSFEAFAKFDENGRKEDRAASTDLGDGNIFTYDPYDPWNGVSRSSARKR